MPHKSYPIEQNQGGWQMLVLTRKLEGSLLIGDNIKITIKEINSSHIKLCVNDSESITVDKWKSKIIAYGKPCFQPPESRSRAGRKEDCLITKISERRYRYY